MPVVDTPVHEKVREKEGAVYGFKDLLKPKYHRVEPTGELVTMSIIYKDQMMKITVRAHSLAEAEEIILKAYTGAKIIEKPTGEHQCP